MAEGEELSASSSGGLRRIPIAGPVLAFQFSVGLVWWLGLGSAITVFALNAPWWVGWLIGAVGGSLIGPGIWLLLGIARRRTLVDEHTLVVRGWPWRQDVRVPRSAARRFDSVEYSDARLTSLLWLLTLQQLFWQLEVKLATGEVVRVPASFTDRRASRSACKLLNEWLVAGRGIDDNSGPRPGVVLEVVNTCPRWASRFPWVGVGLVGAAVACLATYTSAAMEGDGVAADIQLVMVALACSSALIATLGTLAAQPQQIKGQITSRAS